MSQTILRFMRIEDFDAHEQVLLRRIDWTRNASDVLIDEDRVSVRVHCHKAGWPSCILICFAL